MSEHKPLETKNAKVVAGIAGCGSGTLLTALASTFDGATRDALIAAAPAVTVVCGFLWGWVFTASANYFIRRGVRAKLVAIRDQIKAEIEYEHTTPSHKKILVKRYQAMQLVIIDREIEQIESVSYISPSDVDASKLLTPKSL